MFPKHDQPGTIIIILAYNVVEHLKRMFLIHVLMVALVYRIHVLLIWCSCIDVKSTDVCCVF